MSVVIRTKTAFQNALDRHASKIEKITRAVNAQYRGAAAVDLTTGMHGTIKNMTYEPSVWNRRAQGWGDWNVELEIGGYGVRNISPEAVQLEAK